MRLRNIPTSRQELAETPYVIGEEALWQLRGRWAELFGDHHPIRIEIGMGKGRFLLELSRRNPDINFIGIERYSSVLVHPVRRLREEDLIGTPLTESDAEGAFGCFPSNAAPGSYSKHLSPDGRSRRNLYLLRMDAERLMEVFAPGEVDRIYLNFSDPWPKDRHAKRRLPGRAFLARYEQILSLEGMVEFKTDNRALFDFALEEAKAADWTIKAFTYDLHRDPVMNEGNILTEYEKKFSELGNPICKLVECPPRSC